MRHETITSVLQLKGLKNAVYLISNEKGPVYVGMGGKQCVAARIVRHIGDVFFRVNPSKLSRFLFDNNPDCLNWSVDIYSLDDVTNKTGIKTGCASCAEKVLYDYLKVNHKTPSQNARKPSTRCFCNI